MRGSTAMARLSAPGGRVASAGGIRRRVGRHQGHDDHIVEPAARVTWIRLGPPGTILACAKPAPDPATYPVFGHDGRGTVAACTNPAALRAGTGDLKPYLLSGTVGISVTTPYVQLPRALRARCAHRNGMTYLAMSSRSESGDPRNVEAAVTNVGFWGLHLIESNLTQGNLIELVQRQSRSAS
jgi:hypothetical protein